MPELDPNITELTPENWLELVEVADEPRLVEVLKSHHPSSIAALISQLPVDFRLHIFGLLDREIAAEVIAELDDDVQVNLMKRLNPEKVADIVLALDSDDAVDLLGVMPVKRLEAILINIPESQRNKLLNLLEYDSETAGGIMASETVAAPAWATVGEVIEYVREAAKTIEDIYYVYLVDHHRRFVGGVTLKDLVLTSNDQFVKEIINPDIVPIHVGMDREKVAEIFRRYDLASAPVIDEHNRLIGRITHDDILDVVTEEADEDIAHFTGQADIVPSERSLLKNVRYRLPWLLIAMIGSLGAATVISHFEGQISRLTTLVFFMPLIPAMGGNAGIQTSAVMVRGLATGEIGGFDLAARLFREMLIALSNGFVCGISVFLITYFWQNDWKLSFAVSVSLVSVIALAAMIGATIPLFLRKIGVDPAVATGPFITTVNDITGVMLYMLIAQFMLF